jgi:NAD(P)-dependent dehydrogenase (short-subunit alcohol dehydrogenase family)
MSKQKVWLITGASKGLGFEIAKAALVAGDNVIATVRNETQKLKSALSSTDNLLIELLDVTDESNVRTCVEHAIDHFGSIDVLVNNAGYGLVGAIEEITDREARSQYDTNVFGMLHMIRAVLPHMRENKSGHIINISSLFFHAATVPGFGIYSSTKFAVEGISEGLALETRQFGVHVTSVAPGLFRTQFNSPDSYRKAQTVLSEYGDTVGKVRIGIDQYHGKQPGDPAKLAAVIIHLAASENPPLHVPIGKDSVEMLKSKISLLKAELSEWETVASSTDFTN